VPQLVGGARECLHALEAGAGGGHPRQGDVYAATIPSLDFKPALHVNYAETKLRIRDGLPKMSDMPAEMGGTGKVLAE
jgi:hypothetical protein